MYKYHFVAKAVELGPKRHLELLALERALVSAHCCNLMIAICRPKRQLLKQAEAELGECQD